VAGRALSPSLRLPASQEARLLRRYKRFLADVETAEGDVLTVHCPNPGSMRGLLLEGAPVRCSSSDDPRRKLRHTLEMISIRRTWVGLHTGRANAVVRAALEAGGVPELSEYRALRGEVAAGGGSRFDFRLEDHPSGAPDAWLEVKSVTMAEGRLARFPDAVTERGRRHAIQLGERAKRGERAVLLFLVQRGDCQAVEPADDIDPAYGKALRAAVSQGLEVQALRARVSPTRIRVEGPLPVLL
jgi:sugar fermentation stimulation protein A